MNVTPDEPVKELRLTKDLLRGLLESAPDAMVVVDKNGTIQIVNSQTVNVFGYSKEELLGKKIEFLIPERYRKRHHFLRADYTESPGPRPMGSKPLDFRGLKKNGAEFPAEISLSPLNTSDGDLLIYAAIRDISMRKKQDEQIKYQADLIGNIQDAAISLDRNLIIQSWNKGAEKIYGWTSDEVIGKDIESVFKPQYPGNTDKTNSLEYLISKGSYSEETVHSRKDGERINILSIGNLVKNENNEITGIITINRDITDIKAVEDDLKEREEQIRTIFHNAPEAVILFDENTEIKEWNPYAEKLFGWKKEEVLNKRLFELIYPEEDRLASIESIIETIRSLTDKLQPLRFEIPAMRKNSTEFDAGMSISPLMFRGKFFFIGFLTDITFRKKAEAELKKKSEELIDSNKELEQFAYIASHDLQEPLRMVSGYVQLLEKRYREKLDEDGISFINFALEGSARMRKLIHSLLEYSRVNRIKSFEIIKTDNLLGEVLNDLRIVIKENKAEIYFEKLPDIFGDPVLISQLFQNLIGNALKFRKEEPLKIFVSACQEGDCYRFSVKDNGIGIDSNYHEKVFEMFRRLHSRDKYPGTGLGLAICKKIVERHGGKIWLQSVEEQGAEFIFTINRRHGEQVF